MNTELRPQRAASVLARARVAVLMGGRSSEREISLSTGRGVLAALAEAPQDDSRGPLTVRGVEIDGQGKWSVDGRALQPDEALSHLKEIDVFFLALHGGDGEDGTLQGFLELAGKAYTGSGVHASAVCMDKLALRGLAQAVGVRVAPGELVTRAAWAADRAGWMRRLEALSTRGWVAKPRSGGSSVATSIVGEPADFEAALREVFETGDDALVEGRILGVELSCGVLGNRGAQLRALQPIEIRPRAGKFFDYEQKYSSDGALELCPPQGLAPTMIERVQVAAVAIHDAAGCDGYSRTDFIVPQAELSSEDEPVLLEVNTLPGLTARSLLPQEAAVAGLDYRSLCLLLLELAFQRRA